MTGVTNVAGTGPLSPAFAGLAASVDRQALVPMTAGYLILMAALAFGLWRMYRPGKRQRPGPRGGLERPPPGEPQAPPGEPRAGPAAARRGSGVSGRAVMARMVISTVVGGYLLLMAVVVAYYYGVARVGNAFLQSAVTGTLLLIGLVTPVYAAASWLTERPRRRHDRPAGTGQRRNGGS